MPLVDRRQVGILADRYLDVLLGDMRALALLFVQAPLIGALVAGVFADQGQDSKMLYFVLCLSAFFLGAVNSAREVVKERDLFLRERMFNLSVGAYLLSKYKVQAILMVLESAILVGVVRWSVPLAVSTILVALVVLLVSLVGMAIGLLLSSLAHSTDQAVMAVPLVVIPQILFSEFVLGDSRREGWTHTVRSLMPVEWGYRILREMRINDGDAPTMYGGPLVLLVMIAVVFLVSSLVLGRAKA